LPQPGETVTYYGMPTGIGPLLVTTAAPTRSFLATGTRQLVLSDEVKPAEPVAADAPEVGADS
jgi:hypothetical protein